MPALEEIRADGRILLSDIEALRQFLIGNPTAERAEFLPFFSSHAQLCTFLRTLYDRVKAVTHWKRELDLFGDFKCDLAVGSANDGAFVLVEFEDAGPKSLFDTDKRVKNSVWGRRVEQAVSQVNDWLFRVNSEGPSPQMERDFGNRNSTFMGVIVVGRSADVSRYDRSRLDWPSQNTIIGGSKLSIFTYDDLLDWLDGRANHIASFSH
jgi:hypothetical protein